VLTPALLTVLLMSIIRGLETFEIEMVLGAPIRFEVYSNKIYLVMASSPPEFRVAGMLGISVMLICLPLIILQRWLSTRRSYAVVTGRSSHSPLPLGRWRWPVFVLMLLGTTAISLLPLTLLIAGSFMKLFGFFDLPQVWTADHWLNALADITFASSLRNMLLLGLGTALIGASLYALVAYAAVRTRSKMAAPLDWLSWLPLTIPGIILGFGYLTMAIEVPLFSLLYGNLGALILVSVLAAMPLGIQVLKVQMLQMGSDIEEAGRIVGGTWGRTFWHIMLPLSVPTLAVVAVMVFASTIRAVSTVMLLSSGNNRVLSVLQVEFLSSGNLGPAAVVGTVIVLVSLAAALLVRLISVRFGVHAR
jgi:iron(III) transport system permease protein